MYNSIKCLFAVVCVFSFNASASELLSAHADTNGSHYVKIQREALGKEFLLHRFSTPLIHDATHAASCTSGGKDIIVHFVSSGKSVQMLGSTEGITVDPILQAKMLLAEFPIILQEPDFIVFDFNVGMKRDLSTAALHNGHSHFQSIAQSYIGHIESKKSGLQIKQVVQYENLEAHIEGSQESAKTFTLMKDAGFGEIQYLIYPYSATPDFVSSESPDHEHVYFKTDTSTRESFSGRVKKKDLKWSLNEPIRFYISANMPQKYRQAAKEGLLYWNLAFGKKVIQVFDAPHDVVAPSVEHNVVQWLDSDGAGAAYADSTHDPRTGEIKHAQIFIPSGRIKSEEERLRARYREVYSAKQHQGIWGNVTGIYALDRVVFNSLPTPFELNKLMADAIRILVAHEAGHALGLRHNFLASVAGNITGKRKNDLLHAYMFGQPSSILDGQVLTTSVMEYLDFDSHIPAGAQIGRALTEPNGRAFQFDEMAIQRLYFGSEQPQALRFTCWDEHVGHFIDCKRHDFATDAIHTQYLSLKDALERLPNQLVEGYIFAKETHGEKVVSQVSIEPKVFAQSVAGKLADMLAPLDDANRMRSVEVLFPHSGDTYAKQIANTKNEMARESFRKLGGVEQALFFLLPPHRDSEAAIAAWKRILRDYLQRNYQGFLYGGVPYHLTSAEMAIARAEIDAFFPLVEEAVRKATLTVLAEAVVSDPELGLEFEAAILRVADHILFAFDKSQTIDVPVSADMSVVLRLAKRRYDLETRMKAVNLLFAKVATGIDWSASDRKMMLQNLSSVASIDPSTFRGHPYFIEIRKRISEAGLLAKSLSR